MGLFARTVHLQNLLNVVIYVKVLINVTNLFFVNFDNFLVSKRDFTFIKSQTLKMCQHFLLFLLVIFL